MQAEMNKLAFHSLLPATASNIYDHHLLLFYDVFLQFRSSFTGTLKCLLSFFQSNGWNEARYPFFAQTFWMHLCQMVKSQQQCLLACETFGTMSFRQSITKAKGDEKCQKIC